MNYIELWKRSAYRPMFHQGHGRPHEGSMRPGGDQAAALWPWDDGLLHRSQHAPFPLRFRAYSNSPTCAGEMLAGLWPLDTLCAAYPNLPICDPQAVLVHRIGPVAKVDRMRVEGDVRGTALLLGNPRMQETMPVWVCQGLDNALLIYARRANPIVAQIDFDLVTDALAASQQIGRPPKGIRVFEVEDLAYVLRLKDYLLFHQIEAAFHRIEDPQQPIRYYKEARYPWPPIAGEPDTIDEEIRTIHDHPDHFDMTVEEASRLAVQHLTRKHFTGIDWSDPRQSRVYGNQRIAQAHE